MQIAKNLKNLKFEVFEHYNVKTAKELDYQLLPAFANAVNEGDIALIYYSGHGFSHNGSSYMVPTELGKEIREARLPLEATPVENLESRLLLANPSVLLTLIDACRSMPSFTILLPEVNQNQIAKGFANGKDRNYPNGLNVLFGYGTAFGAVALGSSSQKALSYFTQGLSSHIEMPDSEFGLVYKLVTRDVLENTSHDQKPSLVISSTAELYLNPTQGHHDQILKLWMSRVASGSREEILNFLALYPASRYAKAARLWLQDNPPSKTAALENSGISPFALERAWDTSSSASANRAFDITPLGFRYQKKINLADLQQLRTLDNQKIGLATPSFNASSSVTPQYIADAFKAHGRLVVAETAQARLSPSLAADSVYTVAPGTEVSVISTSLGPDNRVWIYGKIPQWAFPVFLPTQALQNGLAAISLGKPLTEIYLPPPKAGVQGMPDSSGLMNTLKSLSSKGNKILWASVSISPSSDKRENLLRQSRAMNAAYILSTEAKLPRSNIYRFESNASFNSNDVQVRLFGE